MKKLVCLVLVILIFLTTASVLAENTVYYGDGYMIIATEGVGAFYEGLASVNKDGKWGFIDKNGTAVVSLIYDSVGDFYEGLAWVKKDGKYGFIDKNGTVVVPLIYDNVDLPDHYNLRNPFLKGLACVKKDGKYGFIDKSGTMVVPLIYDGASAFREEVAVVRQGQRHGLIDKDGMVVVPPIYDYINIFREGIASVNKDGEWGFIDKDGTVVVPLIYDRIGTFNEGFAWVEKDGKYGFVDKTGAIVVPLSYKEWDIMDLSPREGLTGVLKLTGMFENGVGCGFIDNTGTVAVPLIYDRVESFSEGFASVCKDGQWGFIDKDGTMAVSLIYDSVGNFHEGLAWVEKDRKWGFIDKKGMVVVPLIYDWNASFYEGNTWVIKNGKWFLLTQTDYPNASSIASTVLVNGKPIAFEAYNINDNNYFKLRDLAYVLNGTSKQFTVGWDGAANAISLISGQPYATVGGEMDGKGSGEKTATPTDSKITLDGKEVSFTAYNIDGNNYFKLRDIGAAFNFGVDWDGENNTIVIDTSKGYTE